MVFPARIFVRWFSRSIYLIVTAPFEEFNEIRIDTILRLLFKGSLHYTVLPAFIFLLLLILLVLENQSVFFIKVEPLIDSACSKDKRFVNR